MDGPAAEVVRLTLTSAGAARQGRLALLFVLSSPHLYHTNVGR